MTLHPARFPMHNASRQRAPSLPKASPRPARISSTTEGTEDTETTLRLFLRELCGELLLPAAQPRCVRSDPFSANSLVMLASPPGVTALGRNGDARVGRIGRVFTQAHSAAGFHEFREFANEIVSL